MGHKEKRYAPYMPKPAREVGKYRDLLIYVSARAIVGPE